VNVIDLLQREQEKPKVPVLRSGDTVRVHVKVVEGTRERIQAFEGIVIAVNGKVGIATSFTVRRISHGVGVERTFLLHSPRVDRIEVLRHGDVRRAKLFYLREKVGKRARVRERREPVGGAERVMVRDDETAELDTAHEPEPAVAPDGTGEMDLVDSGGDDMPVEAEVPKEAPVGAASGDGDGGE